MTDTMLSEIDVPTTESPSAAERGNEFTAFKNVLVGVDGTSSGRDAIALAERLRAPDGRMTLAHVVLVQKPIYGNFHSTGAGRMSREMLERQRVAAGVSASLAGMFAPSVGRGLHQLAADYGADLLVVGSCRRGSIGRLLRGDDTQGSLSGAPCAVAVAPHGYGEASRDIETIGVAYNGSPESETALAAARYLAAGIGAAPRALTVVWPTASVVWPDGRPPPGGAWGAMTFEAFEREASERLSSLGNLEGRVAVGPPRDELVAFADDVDLLVVGSRGHGRLRRLLLGSASAYLARTARCPLLVLPAARRAASGQAR